MPSGWTILVWLAFELIAGLVGKFADPAAGWTIAVVVLFLGYMRVMQERDAERLMETSDRRVAKLEAKLGRLTSLSELVLRVGRLRPETLRGVAVALIARLIDTVRGGREITGEPAYLEYLSDRVKAISGRSNASLHALCANKTWDSPFVDEYWRVNREAVNKFNLPIERVFLDLDPRVGPAAKAQAAAGIKVWVVPKDSIGELNRAVRIPSDVGFAILDGGGKRELVIHWGVESDARAYVIEDSDIVDAFQRIFERAKGLGNSIQG